MKSVEKYEIYNISTNPKILRRYIVIVFAI